MNKYNPDGSQLRADQLKMLDVLVEFSRICKENGITWWLDSGTLLGAVRHGGFIPWDDDVDVCVMKKDYKRLRKILCSLNSDKYFYSCIQTDVEHVNPFGKFRLKEGGTETTDPRSHYFKYNGPGLDVFSVEDTSHFSSPLFKVFSKNMQHPIPKIKNAAIRHFVTRLVEVISFGFLLPLCRLIGYINPKHQYYYELGSGFYKNPMYMDQIFPLGTITFEGVEFPAPRNVDAYLQNLYGDWHQLPTDEQIKKSLHNRIYLKEIYG